LSQQEVNHPQSLLYGVRHFHASELLAARGYMSIINRGLRRRGRTRR